MDADTILDRRRLKRRLVFWRTAAIVAVVGALAGLAEHWFASPSVHIARLQVVGLIVEDHYRDAAIAELAKDDRVKALIVRINSPGGTTTGSEELFQGLRRVAGQHRRGLLHRMAGAQLGLLAHKAQRSGGGGLQAGFDLPGSVARDHHHRARR